MSARLIWCGWVSDRHRLSGTHREALGQYYARCTFPNPMLLLCPMYAVLPARPMWTGSWPGIGSDAMSDSFVDVLTCLQLDYIGRQSGRRIGYCEAGITEVFSSGQENAWYRDSCTYTCRTTSVLVQYTPVRPQFAVRAGIQSVLPLYSVNITFIVCVRAYWHPPPPPPHSKRNKRSVSHHTSFQLLLLDDGDVKVILNFTLVEGAFHHGRFLQTLQLCCGLWQNLVNLFSIFVFFIPFTKPLLRQVKIQQCGIFRLFCLHRLVVGQQTCGTSVSWNAHDGARRKALTKQVGDCCRADWVIGQCLGQFTLIVQTLHHGGEGILVYYAFVECYLVCGTALVEVVFLSWCTVYSAHTSEGKYHRILHCIQYVWLVECMPTIMWHAINFSTCTVHTSETTCISYTQDFHHSEWYRGCKHNKPYPLH